MSTFGPQPFSDLSSAGKSICIVLAHIFVFCLNLSQYWWLWYFGAIFSFPFFSPSRSDFRNQSGRAEQQHTNSLCLWRSQGVQAEKKPHERCLWMTDPDLRHLKTFIYTAWTGSDLASTLSTTKQEAEFNKSTAVLLMELKYLNGDCSDSLAKKV